MSEQRAYAPPPAATPLPPQSGLPQATSPIDSALALGGRAQLPPSNVGASLPTPQVQPLDTAPAAAKAPPQVSDPLGYAYNVIGQGETGNDPDAAHRLYGARPSYFGFPDFHATGPTGAPTSAAGKVQWEADTWKGAATAYVNAGNPTPDFNKAEDQEKVFRFWAPLKYAEATHGRNLVQDIAAGVDWKTPLAATWPSLVPNSLHNPARPDLNGVIASAQQAGNELHQNAVNEMSTIQGEIDRYKQIAMSAPPGSREMDEALARQTELSERAAKTFDELAAHPPVYSPKDVMQRFGSLATVIAVLGGLKSRQPLTAALNASGQAMKALNQNNYDNYKIAYDQWKTQTDLVVQSLRAHSEAINQILSNKRLSQEEKNSELNALATVTGNEFLKAKVAAGDIQAPFQMQLEIAKIAQQAATSEATMERLNAYLQIAMGKVNKAGPTKTYEYTTPDGKQAQVNVQQMPDGSFRDASTGQPMTLPADAKAVSVGQGGRQAQQLTAIRGSANEAVASLQNLSEFPITANLGALSGIQYRNPDDISDAIRKALARQFTPSETRALDITFTGLGRSLAQIEAQGRATGLVGLANQMDRLHPQSGDPPLAIMRIYAEARQIIDRGVENAAATGHATPEELALFQKIKAEAEKAIPFTVHDVNTIEFKGQEGIAEVAKRMFAEQHAKNAETAGAAYNSPQDVYDAFDKGLIKTKEEAKQILIDKFGFKPQ